MTSGSVSFDRAAGFYDRTRGLGAEQEAAQTALLRSELVGTDRVLEIGIGTGRVAVPLAAAGVRVVGIDLSAEMLKVLLEKDNAIPVAIGDACRLPFPDRSFGAALSCHVLHLIPTWRAAVDELLRVVRPGGVLLFSQGGLSGDDPTRELVGRLRAAAGVTRHSRGVADVSEVDDYLGERGVVSRRLPPIPRGTTHVVAEFFTMLEDGCWSWTWDVDPAVLAAASAETRAWAEQRWGDLSAARIGSGEIEWYAYDLL
jgi:SAM-dependent methyltransferase